VQEYFTCSKTVTFVIVLATTAAAVVFLYQLDIGISNLSTFEYTNYSYYKKPSSLFFNSSHPYKGYRYRNGTAFNISTSYLHSLGFPINCDSVTLSMDNAAEFVFVTAADEAHFHFAINAIATIQNWFPNYVIFYYDLAVNSNSTRVKKIRQLRQVLYRQFNYSRYPSHVRDLKLYAFKAIIVHEMLLDHRGVFWLDSSVRFKSSKMQNVYKQAVCNGGILTFADAGHSNFAVIHQGMYRYLPIPRDMAIKTVQKAATVVYFYRTKMIYDEIISWWFLCSLEHDCMASSHSVYGCSFRGNGVYAGCHRFDQSALNILMANLYEYDVNIYHCKIGVLEVLRRVDDGLDLQINRVDLIKSKEFFI
jgi:hypothetical protein